MKIVRLETQGVRGLRDGAWTFAPGRGGPGHVTVVTGPPSVGLTTFLDAIGLTAARLSVGGLVPDSADVVRAGGVVATIRSSWQLDADERAFGGLAEETADAEVVYHRRDLGRGDADPGLLALMSRYDHTDELSKVVSIPASRVTDGSFPAFGDFETEQGFRRLSPDASKFAGLPYALAKHAAGFGDRARFEAVRQLFGELCSTARLAGSSAVGKLELALPTGALVPLHRLGFAERNAFVLAAVPVIYGLKRSVILLDTPELGLAPGVAARWLGALRGYAPEAQWIVASRDPAVIAGVDPAARIDLGREVSP